MSTVVDNDKYIINGSTLSEIGDAVKGQMLNQYEKATGDVVCYKYTSASVSRSDVPLLDLTEEQIQKWYQNTLPSPIKKVKIINTSNDGHSSYVVVDSGGHVHNFELNQPQKYSLPITIIGNGSYYSPANFTYKIYPLNGENYLFWDSNYYYPSSSSDYNNHLYKEEVSYERPLPNKSNFLVSDIAQRIASLPSLSGAQIDFIKMCSKGSDPSTKRGTNLLTTMGIKDISDIYYIIGYNDYRSFGFPKGLVYLDMIHHPNPVSTGTYAKQTINQYQFYYLPQTSSSSGQNPEAIPYVKLGYWKSQNCFVDRTNNNPQFLAEDSDGDPAFVMVIHKPTSSS